MGLIAGSRRMQIMICLSAVLQCQNGTAHHFPNARLPLASWGKIVCGKSFVVR